MLEGLTLHKERRKEGTGDVLRASCMPEWSAHCTRTILSPPCMYSGFPRWLRGLKNPAANQEAQETRLLSLGWEDPLEEGMTTHSSILTWRNTGTEEPGGLQSMGSQRVRHA